MIGISGTYINLPVEDVKRTRAFYSALGFSFNEDFSNEQAACMPLGKESFAMLLEHAFFKGFTPLPIADAKAATGVLTALGLADRAAVDALVDAAIKAGGTEPRPAQDHGFMYSRAFADLDGHIWEPFWMSPAQDAASITA